MYVLLNLIPMNAGPLPTFSMLQAIKNGSGDEAEIITPWSTSHACGHNSESTGKEVCHYYPI